MKEIKQALENCFRYHDAEGDISNICDALTDCARGLFAIAGALERLGMNGASTPMGALESLGLEVRGICEAIRGLKEE
jgi:hypothetical protein